MRPLRTINDFLDLAARQGSAALSRACQTGNYSAPREETFLGGLKGWVFEVWSDHSRWEVRIAVNEGKRCYQVFSQKLPSSK